MLKIRLRRVGKKRHPYYRVVVAENLGRRDGRFLESLGSYDPHSNPPVLNVNEESAKAWLVKGAQPSDAVEKIFRRVGVIDGGPLKRTMVEKAAPAEEAPAAKAEAPAAAAVAGEAPAVEAEAPAAEAEGSSESEES